MSTPESEQTVTKRSFQDTLRDFRRNFSPTLGLHRPKIVYPPEHRANFRHLYLEIAWYAILNGTVLSFFSVFATRAGATGQQVGLIGAAPAIANLIFSIPASMYMQKLPTARIVTVSAVLQRVFYLFFAVLPFFVSSQPLVWALIIGTFLLSIPGTGLAVSVNALIAQTIPVEWRAHVVSRRNILLSLITIITLTISGQLLTRIEFPLNYQIVFFIGFVGAMMSSLHLSLIKPAQETQPQKPQKQVQVAEPKAKTIFWRVRPDVRKRIQQANQPSKPSFLALRGKYGLVLLILFLYWFALYLSAPIFPVYQVNELNLTDRIISMGSSVFSLTTLLGATQVSRLARRYSNHRLTSVGLMLSMIYPFFLPLSRTPAIFILVSAAGGIGWATINSCLMNYLYEQIPSTSDLAGHLAWYNVALNAAILVGSLLGPAIAGGIGLTTALIIFGVGRLLAGVALLRWG
ncbi:MAG: MFS transporter [Anaerolineaceae bacterium]